MTHFNTISPQYITKEKIYVTILKVIDPAHYVVKELPNTSNASLMAKHFLDAETEMQIMYGFTEQTWCALFEEHPFVVVSYKKHFYRAKILRFMYRSIGHNFIVYLVDYGIECTVPREDVYIINRDYLRHPFQAVDLKLLGIELVSDVTDKIPKNCAYGPVEDIYLSARTYITDLEKNAGYAYVEVQGYDDLHIYGRLYLCYENNLIKCINEELVLKSYACFKENHWKYIRYFQNIQGDSEKTSGIATVQSNKLENVNLKQMPCTTNLSKTQTDIDDLKVMFPSPVDGKIVAESTSIVNDTEKLTEDGESKLQGELLAQKRLNLLQELFNRKRSQPIKTSSIDDANNKNLHTTTGNENVKKNSVIQQSNYESNQATSATESKSGSEIMPQGELLAQKKLKFLQELFNRKRNQPIKTSSIDDANNKDLQTTTGNENVKNSVIQRPSYESNQAPSTTESKSGSENVSRDKLLLERTLKRLVEQSQRRQEKRKGVSPLQKTENSEISDIKSSESNLSTNKEEADVKVKKDSSLNKAVISNDHLNILPVNSSEDQPLDKSIQETPKKCS